MTTFCRVLGIAFLCRLGLIDGQAFIDGQVQHLWIFSFLYTILEALSNIIPMKNIEINAVSSDKESGSISSIYIWSENSRPKSEAKDGGN